MDPRHHTLSIDRRRAGDGRRASDGRRSRAPTAALALGAFVLIGATAAPAAGQQEHGHDGHTHHEDGHVHDGLHFTHPMIAESVTPDTKIRMDHQFFDFPGGATENSGGLAAEYAFHRAVSLEVGLPYSYTATELGNFSALLKFANYAFEDSGVLFGYGLGVTFPTNGSARETGHTHEAGEGHGEEGRAAVRPSLLERGGSGRPPGNVSPPAPRFHGAATGVTPSLGTQEWEVEPYLNFGYRGGAFELTAWTRFGIPFNHAEQHDVGSELRWNVAALAHASSRLQALVELDGSSGISGHPVGEDVAFVSPGLRVKPFAGRPLWVGSAVGFPLASDVGEDPFDVRWKTSLFWHF